MNKKVRRIITMAICTLLLLCACNNSGAAVKPEDLNVPQFEDNQSIVIGTWSGSMVNWSQEQFDYLKNANINLLLGVSEYMGYSNAFFDMAQAAGVGVFPDSRSWNGEVSEFVDHPAFLGYCVWDEPTDLDFPALAEKRALWEQTMREKMFFVNLFPGDVGSNQFGGYDNYVSSFIQTVNPEVVSLDHYPLMKDYNGNTIVKDSFFNNLDVCSYYAKEAGLPFWFSFLTSKHMNYVEPTMEELRWQMAVGQAYGATGLVHYVYASHDSDYTCPIDWKSQTPTELYNSMAEANAEVAAWDHIYMQYDWQGTATINGSSGTPCTGFLFCTHAVDPKANTGITAIESSEALLCGIFKDANGKEAFMLTNATNPADEKDTTVKLTLNEKYKGVLVIDAGKQSVMVLKDQVATIQIGSSKGVFVIPLTTK